MCPKRFPRNIVSKYPKRIAMRYPSKYQKKFQGRSAKTYQNNIAKMYLSRNQKRYQCPIIILSITYCKISSSNMFRLVTCLINKDRKSDDFRNRSSTSKYKSLFLNTSYLTDSGIVFTLKMESVSKMTFFGLKMMVKSGLEKIILKFLHALTMSFLLLNLHF